VQCDYVCLTQTARDEKHRYFIDRDGTSFRHVLNFMRSGRLSLPMNFDDYEALLWDAEFYQVGDCVRLCALCTCLRMYVCSRQVNGLRHAIFEQLRHVRRERVARYLNLAGLDLSGAQVVCCCMYCCTQWVAVCSRCECYLTPLQLAGVDLAGASLRGMNLRGACLDGATLRGADLRQVRACAVLW
jgi:hypothetical protein